MFKPFFFSFKASSGDSASLTPLVANIVIKRSLCAAPMISGISSRCKGSPPENNRAGGLGLRLLRKFSICTIFSLLGS